MTARAQAEPWALLGETTTSAEHEAASDLDLPSVLTASYAAAVDGQEGQPRFPLAIEDAPRPLEELPVPPGQPPPKPPSSGSIPGANVDDRDRPLTLSDVLESVMRHYPLLLAVERQRGVAAGQLTKAMGAFDTNVFGRGDSIAPGTYENYLSDFGMDQLLQQGGISVFGGYRTGFGEFPTYKLQNLTAAGGEVRGGVSVPLARNRDIDQARADRAQAQLDIAIAEPMIARSRLDYMRTAAASYWAWNGSGEQREAAEFLVDLAAERDLEIALRVDRGAMANIERIDNQQNIALRQGLVVKTDRMVQKATIDLSLFYRDEGGKPLLVGRRRMRPAPEPVEPTEALYYESLTRALGRRPEFQQLSLEREKLIVQRRLAYNDTLPGMDAQLAGNQDVGFGKSSLSGPEGLNRQVLSASLVFQMPAQRRGARGRLQSLDARLAQIDEQLRYTEDNVRAEVQNAYTELERAYEFYDQVQQRVELAATVARAEREQLRLGRSDVLRVTLREQAKFDAEILEIAARQHFWTAESDLRAADTSLGPGSTGLTPPQLPPPETVPPPAEQLPPPDRLPLPPPAGKAAR